MKTFNESNLKILLKYGRVEIKGMKEFHFFARYAEEQGYEIEPFSQMNGNRMTVKLIPAM